MRLVALHLTAPFVSHEHLGVLTSGSEGVHIFAIVPSWTETKRPSVDMVVPIPIFANPPTRRPRLAGSL